MCFMFLRGWFANGIFTKDEKNEMVSAVELFLMPSCELAHCVLIGT
jgi:hypothetical protein